MKTILRLSFYAALILYFTGCAEGYSGRQIDWSPMQNLSNQLNQTGQYSRPRQTSCESRMVGSGQYATVRTVCD